MSGRNRALSAEEKWTATLNDDTDEQKIEFFGLILTYFLQGNNGINETSVREGFTQLANKHKNVGAEFNTKYENNILELQSLCRRLNESLKTILTLEEYNDKLSQIDTKYIKYSVLTRNDSDFHNEDSKDEDSNIEMSPFAGLAQSTQNKDSIYNIQVSSPSGAATGESGFNEMHLAKTDTVGSDHDIHDFLFETEQEIMKSRSVDSSGNKSNQTKRLIDKLGNLSPMIMSRSDTANAINTPKNISSNNINDSDFAKRQESLHRSKKVNGNGSIKSLLHIMSKKEEEYGKLLKMLENVKDEKTMLEYLSFRDSLQGNYFNVFSIDHNNYNDKSDIMSDWSWNGVAKWFSNFEEFSYMNGIFAEFRINGTELTLLKPFQIEILTIMSHYCDNIIQRPDIYVFDSIKRKINEYRVKTIFKLIYKSTWQRIKEISQSITKIGQITLNTLDNDNDIFVHTFTLDNNDNNNNNNNNNSDSNDNRGVMEQPVVVSQNTFSGIVTPQTKTLRNKNEIELASGLAGGIASDTVSGSDRDEEIISSVTSPSGVSVHYRPSVSDIDVGGSSVAREPEMSKIDELSTAQENKENKEKNYNVGEDGTVAESQLLSSKSKKLLLKNMAILIVDIVSILRSDTRNGHTCFWKEDTIFFDKIDNIVGALIIPNEFQKLFFRYFCNYMIDNNDEDAGFEDNHMYQNKKRGGDEKEIVTELDETDEIDENDKINKQTDKKVMFAVPTLNEIKMEDSYSDSGFDYDDNAPNSHSVSKKRKHRPRTAHVATDETQSIWYQLFLTLTRKNYILDEKKYLNCVSGSDIINAIQSAAAHRSRYKCIGIANKMIIEGWIKLTQPQAPDDADLEKKNKNNDNASGSDSNNNISSISDRGTVFYSFIHEVDSTPHRQDRSSIFDGPYAESSVTKTIHSHFHEDNNDQGDEKEKTKELEKDKEKENNMNNSSVENKNSESNTIDKVRKQLKKKNGNSIEYWMVIGLFIIGILIGCTIVLVWWYLNAYAAILQAMNYTTRSIQQSASLHIESTFEIAQSLLQFNMGIIQSGDIPVDNALLDGNYDSIFTAFDDYDPLNMINALYLYSDESNIMLGGIKPNMTNDTMYLFTYDGNCSKYTTLTTPADIIKLDCDYNATEQAWHKASVNISNNSWIWTKSNQNTDLNDDNSEYNYALVSKINKNGSEIVIVIECEQTAFSAVLYGVDVPLGGKLYALIPDTDPENGNTFGNYSIIASTNDNTDIETELKQYLINNNEENDYKYNNKHVTLSNNRIAVISSFDMVLTPITTTVSQAQIENSNNRGFEDTGYIIIVYNEEYLYWLNTALIFGIVAVILFCLLSFICSYLLFKSEKRNKMSHSKSIWYSTMICLLCLLGALFTNFELSLEAATLSYNELISNIMVKEEYFQIQNRVLWRLVDYESAELKFMQACTLRNDLYTVNNEMDIPSGYYDEYFINIVRSLRDTNGDYLQWGVFVATPNNGYYGVTLLEGYDNAELEISEISPHNGRVREKYAWITDNQTRSSEPFAEEEDFYSVCRPWYTNSIEYSFSGVFSQAFPNNTFNDVFNDDGGRTLPEECETAKETYQILFFGENYTSFDGDNPYDWPSYNITKLADSCWTRYIFSTSSVGITEAMPIINETDGSILSILATDYTLESFNTFLADTNDRSDWISWIFESSEDYNMVASSDGNVLTDASEDLIGLSCYDEDNANFVAYEANEDHPNETVTLISELVVNVYGIDTLPTTVGKYWLDNGISNESETLRTTIDLPKIEAGRVKIDLGMNNTADNIGVTGIDWTIVKAMDLSNITDKIDDSETLTAVISFVMIIIVVYLFIKLHEYMQKRNLNVHLDSNSKFKNKNAKANAKLEYEESIKYSRPRKNANDIYLDWCEIIKDNAKIEWYKKYGKNTKENGTNLLTVNDAIRFAASEAIHHVSKIHNEYAMNDRMIFCDECCLDIESIKTAHNEINFINNINKNLNDKIELINVAFFAHWLLENIIESPIYNAYFVELTILLHIMSAFYEPKTPEMLKQNGWDSGLRRAVSIFIIIEWFDVFIECFVRYQRFRIRTNSTSTYSKECKRIEFGANNTSNLNVFNKFWCTESDLLRVFIGTGKTKFNFYLLTNIIVLINFLLTILVRIGIFSYYLPIVPFLLVFRDSFIFRSTKNLLFGIKYAKDVLITCVTMFVLCAVLCMAMFYTTLNIETSVNTFATIPRALVTSFIMVISRGNYNDIIGTLFDEYDYYGYYLLFFFIVIVLNQWGIVPLLVSRFMNAYRAIKSSRRRITNEIKMNAIVASFIILDKDVSGKLNEREFGTIFRWKDLASFYMFVSNVNKENSDRDRDRERDHSYSIGNHNANLFELSLDDYIKAVLTNRLTFNIDSNFVLTNKIQAYLECKIIYHPLFNVASLLIGILPGMLASLLYGLNGISETTLDCLLIFTFIYNLIEICFIKIWCYGRHQWKLRYFNLTKYEDPPFNQWCLFSNIKDSINISQLSNNQGNYYNYNYMPDSLLYLTHDDWQWAIKWLKNNFINSETTSVIFRRERTMANRIDFIIIFIAIVGVIVHTYIYVSDNDNSNDDNKSYFTIIIDALSQISDYRIFLELPLLRLFTLVSYNRTITFELLTVMSTSYSLLIFAILYVFIWARLGVTLFEGQTDVVLDDIYSTGAHSTFNSLIDAIETLTQVLFGGSWASIMYYNILATQFIYSMYFVTFFLIIIFFVVKIIAATILGGVSQLQQQLKTAHEEARMVNSKYKAKLTGLDEWKLNRVLSAR